MTRDSVDIQKNTVLSERQMRELQFYDEYAQAHVLPDVDFAPVLGMEQRPWNSYWRLFAIIKEHFKSGDDTLLDFGCGDGVPSICYAKIGYEVYGFDISPKNIERAQQLAHKYDLDSKTHFSVSIAEELDFPDESFSVIAGIDILHHVEIERAIAECFRVLKKGGIAVFHEPVRAPVFDRLRESRLGLWLFPRIVSVDTHITEDERKLTKEDVQLLQKHFPVVLEERFYLLAHLNRFIRKFSTGGALQVFPKLDYYIVRAFPFMKPFGGIAVFVLRK